MCCLFVLTRKLVGYDKMVCCVIDAFNNLAGPCVATILPKQLHLVHSSILKHLMPQSICQIFELCIFSQLPLLMLLSVSGIHSLSQNSVFLFSISALVSLTSPKIVQWRKGQKLTVSLLSSDASLANPKISFTHYVCTAPIGLCRHFTKYKPG